MMGNPYDKLSRRERQIMDILLELGRASVEQVRQRLPQPPSYSAARAMLNKLEVKGFARHVERNNLYLYAPAISRTQARNSAIQRLLRVFFGGSAARAVTGMLNEAESLTDGELDEIRRAIDAARRRQKTNRGDDD